MTRAKRDEFSCPCCGALTDSSYCEPCVAAECGERDHDAPDIDECLVERARRCTITDAQIKKVRALLGAAS